VGDDDVRPFALDGAAGLGGEAGVQGRVAKAQGRAPALDVDGTDGA
jgi:hypothetical protein